ncbi:metallophosphoesterase family protein, partial [Candidatus Binatia bacterium]|nr:metallophosphoesterase family protein [Candidatus Binatia bacterium]
MQTSDVHLRPDRPERRRALELVFAQAAARAADVVILAGDLFDRAVDAQAERAAVRKMVEELAPRPVIFVPGNADQDAYTASADFGSNALLLAKTPYTRARISGLEVVGVPYQAGRSLAECLTGLTCEPRHTVLIAHGTLLDAGADAFPGDGEDAAFMPIFAQDLTRRFSYAALGHLHGGDALVRREDQRLIAYAGSPVATSRRELGPRSVVVVDFEPGVGVLAHEVVPLLTPSYELVHVVCLPGAEQDAIERLAREAAAKKGPGVRVIARLSGATTEPLDALRAAAER